MKTSRFLINISLATSLLAGASLQAAKAQQVGEGVLVDVTGAAKNWESGKIIAKDASGYTVRMLGVGDHKGEYHVPRHYLFGYHKDGNTQQANTPTGAPANTATSTTNGAYPPAAYDPVKIGEGVLVDVTGAAKNWESGKVIAKDASGYTVRMLGVGDHKGEYHVPLHYLFGYHKAGNTQQANTSTGNAAAGKATGTVTSTTPRATGSHPAGTTAGSHPATDSYAAAKSAWASLSEDIDARIKKVNNGGKGAAPAGPVKPVSGTKGLSGLYLRHEQVWMGTSLNYNEDHYLFFADGRFYHGIPPEGPGNFNWAKEQQANPDNCGQYGISGNQITLSYPGSAPIVWTIKIKDANQMDLNYAPTVRVEKFGANARISGTYARGTTFGANYSHAGAPTVTSAGIYTFNPNGTVSADSLGGIEGDTKTSGLSAYTRQQNQGTYTINGNDMTLNLGGQSMRCTVYPVYNRGNSQLPARISINGLLYERRK